jgi:hypothetical protein
MSQPELKIQHVATGLSVKISKYGFTEFQDTIETKYNSVNAYGRMDPIVNYQGSTRKISLGIELLSGEVGTGQTKASSIHKYITNLQKMQYPVYKKGSNALTIQRPPLVLVSLANIIRDGDGLALLCAMDGFAFTPNVGFTPENSPMIRWGGGGTQRSTPSTPAGTPAPLPGGINSNEGENDEFHFIRYNFRFNFTVLHRHPVGFTNDSEFQTITDEDTGQYHHDRSQRFMGGYRFGPAKRSTAASAVVVAPTTGLLAEEEKITNDIFGP